MRRCLRGDRDIILTSRAQEGNLQKTSSFKLVFSHTRCCVMLNFIKKRLLFSGIFLGFYV